MAEENSERSGLNTEYANLLLFRLLEILYDSKGKGAKFRTCILGKEDIANYFKKSGLQFGSEGWEENKDKCRDFLQRINIIEDLSCDIKKNEAEISIKSCIHYPMERMLIEEEVPPYTCIPANLLAYGIEIGANKQTEIAKIDTAEDACQIKMLLFEDQD